jgi:hypothetical protein
VAIHLFKLPTYPQQIAASEIGRVATDSAFFLDFSRPIEIQRWLIVRNRWIGCAVGLLVPVIHQGQEAGDYVIGVHRSDTYFADLRVLWKTRYPAKPRLPTAVADALEIIGDFGRQFPSQRLQYSSCDMDSL